MSAVFDFDLVDTFGFDDDNSMIFNLDSVSKNSNLITEQTNEKNANDDAALDDASDSTMEGTPESLSDADGDNATFDFTSPTLTGLDEYAAYNWSDFTYTPLDQANEFYFDSSSKLTANPSASGSLKKFNNTTKRTKTKTNNKKKRTIDFDSPTVSSSPIKKKQRTLRGPTKLETQRLMQKTKKLLDRELSKSLKVVLQKKKTMKNETGMKNAANVNNKSNAGKSLFKSKLVAVAKKKVKRDSKRQKTKGTSKRKSKKRNGKNATGSYSIKQKFNDGIPRIGVYTIPERKALLARFHAKRKKRVFCKKIKYECRKVLANDRPRVRGRFVKVTDLPRYHECLAKGIPFVPTPATK